jgi:hypothetical protein
MTEQKYKALEGKVAYLDMVVQELIYLLMEKSLMPKDEILAALQALEKKHAKAPGAPALTIENLAVNNLEGMRKNVFSHIPKLRP